ncbi:hypothetical protein ACLB2K_070100 [Fragaria x ananassa]
MALEILIESLQTHDDCMVFLEGLVDKSSDSELIGVIWDSWTLKSKHVSVTCDWSKGVKGDSKTEIMAGFREDVEGNSLTPVAPEPSYSYEKLVTWAAMLALITDEVGCEILEFWYAVLDIWWSSKVCCKLEVKFLLGGMDCYDIWSFSHALGTCLAKLVYM